MRRILPAVLAVLLLAGCAAPSPGPTIPDLTGVAGNVARDQLTASGYEVEFDAGPDDSVWMASNWIVQSQSPAAGAVVPLGATVTLSVVRPTPTNTPSPDPITSAGLTRGAAQVACDSAAQAAFPYGYNPAWILGSITQEITSDQWFMKIQVEVKNEYNAERKAIMECTVAGTETAPSVVALDIY